MIFHFSSSLSFLSGDALVLLHTSFPGSDIFLFSFDLLDLWEGLGLNRKSGVLCKRRGAGKKKCLKLMNSAWKPEAELFKPQ